MPAGAARKTNMAEKPSAARAPTLQAQPRARSQELEAALEQQDRISGENTTATRPQQQSGEIDLPESIQYLGRLADKMFTMGRIDAAVNILAGPIAQLLAATKGGLVPEMEEVDAAGRYCIKLATETLDARWVDSAIELHLVTCRPLRADTVEQFSVLRAKVPVGSSSLLRRYQEKLRGHMAGMNADDRALSERVGKLS
jgi:hypothetical protein